MWKTLALALLVGVVLSLPASALGKGFTRVVLISSDGRSLEVRGSATEIDGLLSRRGSLAAIRGGYLRLFFVGPGDFPANPARYYPDGRCVALDRRGSNAPRPRGCYPLTGTWRGPAAELRPRRFFLCTRGIYASGHFHPLRRGVWDWFHLNVGPPPRG